MRRIGVGFSLLSLLAVLAWTDAARAATFVVTKTADTADGACDADCSLREAVIAANADSDADVIEVSAGTYLLTIPVPPGEDDAGYPAAGDLNVTEAVSIEGAGRDVTILDAQGFEAAITVIGIPAAPLFDASLSGMTLKNAAADPYFAALTVLDANFTVADAAFEDNGGVGAKLGVTYFFTCGAQWSVDGVRFERNTDAGLYVSGSVTSCGDVLDVASSTFTDNGYGVFLNSVAATLSSVQVLDNADDGIHVGEGNANVLSSRVAGNRLGFRGGDATFLASTVEGNTEGGLSITDTGGLYVFDSAIVNNGSFGVRGEPGACGMCGAPDLFIVDSTISGNGDVGIDALSGGQFGWIDTTLNHVTITDHALYSVNPVSPDFHFTAVNSILDGPCAAPVEGTNSLSSATGCFESLATNVEGVDPLLGPLQDNGGPTFTHALLPGSPAIDAAASEECPAVDQRGAPRPTDGDGNGVALCDIGAYEAAEGPCHDGDGDGYAVAGGACGPVDCDDGDAGVNPGAIEIWGNAADENCNGYMLCGAVPGNGDASGALAAYGLVALGFSLAIRRRRAR